MQILSGPVVSKNHQSPPEAEHCNEDGFDLKASL